MSFTLVEADLNNPVHSQAIVSLLNAYALDLKGYNRSLPAEVLREVVPRMRKVPGAFVLLAQTQGEYVGMAVCFMGFSTFYARPLVNVHDFTVLKEHRGRGIGTALLEAVERKARSLDCCKVTLETQEKNETALRVYRRCGFEGSVLDESEGRALFLSKYLPPRD